MAKPGRPPTAKTLKDYFSRGENKKRWAEAKENAEKQGEYAAFDDGKYKVQIIKAEVNQSKNSGRLQHVFGFKFLEGEYKGQTIYQYQGVENDVGLSILIATFKKLGYEVEDPEEIEETLDKKVEKSKPVVELRLKTNGEYQNKIVLGLVEKETDAEEEEEDEDVDDEEAKPSKSSKKSKADESEDEDEDDKEDKEDAVKTSSKSGDTDDEDSDEDESDDDEETEEEEDSEDSDDDEESDDDDEDEDEDEEEEEEKPQPKSKKKKEPEPEVDEDAGEVVLKPGLRVKVKYEGAEVKAKIIKVLEEKSQIKVKLANGDKVLIDVPDDVIDILD